MLPPDEESLERVSATVERSMAHAERYVLAAGPEAKAAQRRLERLLRDADALLGKRLNDWIARTGDTEAFTAASVESYRIQIRAMIARSQEALQSVTEGTAMTSWAAGGKAVVDELAALDEAYMGIARTPRIRQALRFDESRGRASSILRSIDTSVDRYGTAMIGEFERTLAIGMTADLSQSEMVDLLTGHGGPTGEVSMRARLVDGRVVRTLTEDIPEGLFRRHRSWAWRIVRTETANAYNGARIERMEELREDIPTLKKKILAHFDNRTAMDSVGVHGQIRDLSGPNSLFVDGAGRVYEHPPARPNDRETTIPWDSEWEEVPSTAELTPNQQEQADQAIARGRSPFDPARRREEDLAAEAHQFAVGERNLNERWAAPGLPPGHSMAPSAGGNGSGFIDVFNEAGTKVSYFKGDIANPANGFTVNVPSGMGLTLESKTFENAIEAANYSIEVGNAIQAAKAAAEAQAAAAAEAALAAEEAAKKAAKNAAKAAKAKATRERNRQARERAAAGLPEETVPTATNRYRQVDFSEDPVARLALSPGFRTTTGTAVPFDADQFEGHEVQFRVERDEHGREWTVARLKLSAPTEQAVAARMAHGSRRIDGYTWSESNALRSPDETVTRVRGGGRRQTASSLIGFERSYANGGRVVVYRDARVLRDSSWKGELSAMHGHVEIHIPTTDPAAVIDHFGRVTEFDLGLSAPTARPTPVARRAHIRARILARYGGQFDAAVAAESSRDAAAIDRVWKQAVHRHPELSRIEATTRAVYTSEGTIAFYSDELSQRYINAGVRRLTHSSGGPPEAIVSIFGDPGQAGIVSTVERWNRGMTTIEGKSSIVDCYTGGADGVFTRLSTATDVTSEPMDVDVHGRWFMEIDPLESGRLDSWGFNADRLGTTSSSERSNRLSVDQVEHHARDRSFSYRNEMMHRRGVPNQSVRRIFVESESDRRVAIAGLRDRGIESLNGQPIEDVIVLRSGL